MNNGITHDLALVYVFFYHPLCNLCMFMIQISPTSLFTMMLSLFFVWAFSMVI